MRPGLSLAGLAMLACSCTRHIEVAKGVARAPMAPTPTVWERQVKNAVDAGDGDYQLRRFRDKIAAEPGNIPARLDLAAAYRERGAQKPGVGWADGWPGCHAGGRIRRTAALDAMEDRIPQALRGPIYLR